MAAMSSLKKLPAGFRLNPRDEDLIYFFLLRKLQNISDPDGNCFVPEHDIYSHDPQDLVAEYDNKASIRSNGLECFFFCQLYKDPNRGCNKRKIAGGKKGFWHQTGEGRQPQPTDKLPWAKRIFCHRLGTQRNSEQTDWVMHEFRLISDERFVLCRITKKPKKKFSASAGKKRKVGSTDDIESHQETSHEVTKKKPNKKLSASTGKKRKVGFTDDSESHQETSLESCVLNDIITKKAKNHTGPSQNDNQTPQAAGSEESVHINAVEFPSTPLSDIITLSDLDMPLLQTMDELLTPLYDYDITSTYYIPEMSPSVNMMGIQTPPLDISISDYDIDAFELAV